MVKIPGCEVHCTEVVRVTQYATAMTITIKPVQLEARKVNFIVRDIMIQPDFNNAHNVWLMCFNQQAKFIKLGDKAKSIKVEYRKCTSIYMMTVIRIKIGMRLRAKGIRARRVCSFYRGNRSSVIRAHYWAKKSICLVPIRVNTNYSVQ